MSQTNWEADKMLDVYIYDYLVKRKLHATAKAFQAEGKVSTDPVAIDAPGGFLFEWWSVFWDIFISRTNEKHSEPATSYIQTQVSKARELQKKQQQEPQNPQQHQQMQMQLLMQRHAQQQQQQQQRDGTQLVNGSSSSLVGDDPMMRQTQGTANSVAAKMYEERLKLPSQKDASDDATNKRAGDNVSQLLDHPNHAALFNAAAGQPPGQTLIGRGIPGNLQQVQNRNQQLSGSTPVDMKNEMNPMVSPHTNGSEGSVIGVHGSNQGSSNITLKGWPLTGFEQLRSLQQKTLTQSPQSFNQLQLQQQLMLRAQQQSLASSSANELENRRIRMLINNQTVGVAKDGLSNVGDLVPNMGSPMQAGCSALPHTDSDMLLKLHLQQNSHQQQQFSQHPLSSQQSQNHIQQTEKIIPGGSMSADGNLSNAFQGNDQASKNQIGRKRKQTVSSSGPANSSGTANTVGPSPSSPSTPSTHTPGDAMSMPTLQQNASSKSLLMFGSDGLGSLSAQNQMADIDRFVGDGSLDDNIESFLSPDGGDPRDGVGNCQDMGKGFTFKDIQLISASSSKVECCDFSSDGKLLATGGHDRKVSLWCTETFALKSNLEEHSQWITDVRFSPSMSRLATSSADRTVKIWDTDNPGYSLRTFSGHSTTVMSLDFHPSKEDLIFSCDNNNEIRYWGIKHGSIAGGFKGGATQMRFQPRHGRLLAAAMENLISILDVETLACRLKLQGHKNLVHSICWDSSGDYLASVSDEMVRIWTVGSSSKGECVHELNSAGNKFNTCAFHPSYPSLLVIGCYETLELWNFGENKTMTIRAHDKLVSSLAVSNVSGLVASASHDKCVKLWK